MTKLSAKEFAIFLKERAAAKDGYIMGARGQNPKDWKTSSWWFTQYSGSQKKKALYWRENAKRVWDCQGLSEGYINQEAGLNIDIRARNNYANWCSPKGEGAVPEDKRVPGVAVFSGWPITHVGYLVEPVVPSKPEGDWYVVEARGVMYGVVTTKLSERNWTRWGMMTKYFDYEDYKPEEDFEIGYRTMKKGMVGSDIQQMQAMLIDLGYYLGKYGADGDFGSMTEKGVKSFQRANRLTITGTVNKDTLQVLLDAWNPEEEPDDEVKPQHAYKVDALDLSSYNSTQFAKIDWQKIHDEVGFLILRVGCTRTKTKPLGIGPDTYFKKYAEKCNEFKIPFWAYYYSHAQTMDEASKEADYAFKMAEEYGPVGYAMDCEEACLKKPGIIGSFFSRINELTTKPTMIYVGHNWVSVYNLSTNDDGYINVADAVWIPRYGKNNGTRDEKYLPKYPCDLWQFTSTFAVDAIPDRTLDANHIIGRHSMAWFRGEEK